MTSIQGSRSLTLVNTSPRPDTKLARPGCQSSAPAGEPSESPAPVRITIAVPVACSSGCLCVQCRTGTVRVTVTVVPVTVTLPVDKLTWKVNDSEYYVSESLL